ncbi:MAG: hypothetical protein GY777_23190 [Candidatus Brocadiaceae bacterium]|nr:hypothetical protein [Candidatus Brocadiaceae bacterium]
MINNPDWQKTKPYLHQLSPECIDEIAVFMEGVTTDEMDCDTCLIMQEILCDEIEDEEFLEFAIDSLEELLSYIAEGDVNIRIPGEVYILFDKSSQKHRYLYSNLQIIYFSSTFLSK